MKIIEKLLYFIIVAVLVIILPDSAKGFFLILVILLWIFQPFLRKQQEQEKLNQGRKIDEAIKNMKKENEEYYKTGDWTYIPTENYSTNLQSITKDEIDADNSSYAEYANESENDGMFLTEKEIQFEYKFQYEKHSMYSNYQIYRQRIDSWYNNISWDGRNCLSDLYEWLLEGQGLINIQNRLKEDYTYCEDISIMRDISSLEKYLSE